MKNFKFLRTFLTLVLAITLVFPSVQVFAKSYGDVPSTHWAYKQIDYVTDAGYMSGNTEGSFEVSQKIDPFEMSKILARVAGFQTGANASSATLSNQEAIYEKHKSFISQYSSFSLWNTSANREIAYLLEKGIFVNDDLNKFVIKTVEKTERVVNPTREDLSYYLVKALNKETEAKALTTFTKFADDSSISSSKKSYAYYLRSKGVLSGDANNNFNPKNNITKAEMATILYNVDTKINNISVDDNTSTDNTGSTGSTNNGGNTGTTTESTLTVVTGTIKEIKQDFKTFRIASSDSGTEKTYVLKSTGTLYLDNTITSISNLAVGMEVSCVIENNSSIVTLRATKPKTVDNGNTGTTDNTNTGNNTNTGTTDNTTITVPTDAVKVKGVIVSSNTGFDASSRTITIGTPSTTLGATTTTNNVTYSVHNNASITHDGTKVLLSQLNPYDYVTLSVSNNTVYAIEAQTRFSVVSGILVEKKFESIDNYIFSVQDRTTKVVTDYKITSTTKYVRDGETSTFDQIRIGDSITLSLDYDKIISANATMTSKSTVKGIIKEITINEYSGTVTIESTSDALTPVTTRNTYTIKSNDYDIYNLRIGYQVSLTLESSEVTAVKLTNDVVKAPVTGVIESIDLRDGEIVLRTSYGFIDVDIDYAKTLVVNTKTGATGTTKDLDKNLNVTVYWNDNSTTATTIMIN